MLHDDYGHLQHFITHAVCFLSDRDNKSLQFEAAVINPFMEGFEVTSHCSPNSQQHLGCERLGYRIRQSAHCLLLIQQHLDMWNIKTKTKNEVLLNGNTKCLSTLTWIHTQTHPGPGASLLRGDSTLYLQGDFKFSH